MSLAALCARLTDSKTLSVPGNTAHILPPFLQGIQQQTWLCRGNICSRVGPVWRPSRPWTGGSALRCCLWVQAWSSKGHISTRDPQDRLGFFPAACGILCKHQTGSILLVPLLSDFLNLRPSSVLELLQQWTLQYLTQHLLSYQATRNFCSPSLSTADRALYCGIGTTAKWMSLREHLGKVMNSSKTG